MEGAQQRETGRNRQVLRVLQLSQSELAEYIRQEGEINPFLLLHDPPEESRAVIPLPEITDDSPWSDDESFEQGESLLESPWGSLYDFLMFQCRELPREEQPTLAFLINNLDQNGYLRISKVEIAAALDLPREAVDRLLRRLQSLDPPGVGARSLRECLILQLRRRGQVNDLTQNMILEDLPAMAAHHYNEIGKKYNVSVETIRQHARMIRALEPKPGRSFQAQPQRIVLPDLEIKRIINGYTTEVRQEMLPMVSVTPDAKKLLESNAALRPYLQRLHNMAHSLVRSIEQREQVLTRIMEAILERQRRFFDDGISGLKPLTLKELSGDTGIHESTLSRAIAGKYVETPRGTVPMKFFFLRGLGMTGANKADEVMSSRSIKARIGELIRAETPKKPLSDQKLAEILMQEGLEISRRTVAKYREEMRVPSSQGRRH